MIRLKPSKTRKDAWFLSDGAKVVLLPDEAYEQGVPHAQLDYWEQKERLPVVRERVRQLHEKIFELSCQLQRQFHAEDVAEALLLVAELKALKTYEEMLTEKASL